MARIGLDCRALGNINRTRGIGQYTAQLVKNLVRIGENIHWILFGYGKEPQRDLLDRRLLDRVEWREIPSLPGPPYLVNLAEHLLFARTVEKAQVNLFHGIDHNMTPFLRCPSIVTVHDLILLILRGPYLGPTAWLWMESHRRACRRAEKVLAVSQSTRRDVERIWGLPEEKIAVIPEGVSPEYRPVEDESEIEEVKKRYGIEKPYFLYLGGFDPRKNIHNMLLGFKIFLRGGNGDYQLVMSGDNRGFEGYLQDEIMELGLCEKVIMTGYVPKEDQRPLYGGARGFVCVSLYEGFGLPLLEAMACGTPVLASQASSIPEVVGNAGLLVDPWDPYAIAEGLQKLAFHEQLRRNLAREGIARAAGFTWEKSAGMVLDLYREVIGQW